jgi:hypothetical protein
VHEAHEGDVQLSTSSLFKTSCFSSRPSWFNLLFFDNKLKVRNTEGEENWSFAPGLAVRVGGLAMPDHPPILDYRTSAAAPRRNGLIRMRDFVARQWDNLRNPQAADEVLWGVTWSIAGVWWTMQLILFAWVLLVG